MTESSDDSTLQTQIVWFSPDIIQQALAPLLDHKPVSLKLINAKLPRKKRPYETTLFLIPSEAISGETGYIVATMPPYGSEILRIAHDFKPTALARTGMSIRLAKALATALRKLYGYQA